MKITVRFVGPLTNLAGVEKATINLNLKSDYTISSLIYTLAEIYGKKFVDRILDHDGKIRPGILILKNDKEIRVLNELKTSVKEEDVITFIPVSHGG
ncbi:MAG: MoaD/ThiS family protein [Candidatus Bathyarchaeota archaeon]|nr:MoaD/ThiS family protein [Candidatus Bathyarchaeota archaeon]